MDTDDLRIVGRVASALSITTVANELQISVGTVSKKLKALEKKLDVQIFDRTTRGIRITDEGKVFLEGSKEIIAAADKACANLDELNRSVRGKLRISVPKSIGCLELNACITGFLLEYPEVALQVDFSSRYANLQEEGYDLAIRTGALSDSTLLAKRIGNDPQVVVAAPNYLARLGKPRRPQDLEDHECLVLGDQYRWTFKKKSNPVVVRVSGRLRANDASTLYQGAMCGLGVASLSRATVEDELQSGRLVELLQDYDTSADEPVYAVYLNTKHVAPRLRAFIDFADEWLKAPPVASDISVVETKPADERTKPPTTGHVDSARGSHPG